MSDEIVVHVVSNARKNLLLQWTDPVTQKRKSKSAKTSSRKEALKLAGELQSQLRAGACVIPSKVTWSTFRERYETEVLSTLAVATACKVATIFNKVELAICPKRLTDLTPARLSALSVKLRQPDPMEIAHAKAALDAAHTKLTALRRESRSTKAAERAVAVSEARLARVSTHQRSLETLQGHLAHLRSALAWAVEQGLLTKVPTIKLPKRAKKQRVMKGRPITGEEFDRMLAAVPRVVLPQPPKSRKTGQPIPFTPAQEADRAAIVASWRHYLCGLWASGLRLRESIELWWDGDGRDDRLSVDLTGKHPVLVVPRGLDKGNEDRVLPMAPEFAEILQQTAPADRFGRVFNPRANRVCGERLGAYRISEIVAEIGRAAGVKVNNQGGRVKYASAHDLRRSFGQRWALRVTSPVLMQLMRHSAITTTLKYYAELDVQATAGVLWAAHKAANVNTCDNTGQNLRAGASPASSPKTSQDVYATGGCDVDEEMRLLGLEPKTYGLKVRCSTD